MKQIHRSLTISLLALLPFLHSCASKNFREPELVNSSSHPTAKTFTGGMDKVWEATKDAMIVTDWATGKSDRLFSGYGDSKIPYTVRFKFLVQLVQAGPKTSVTIKAKEEYMTDVVTSGNNFNGSVYQWIPTTSSGFKESTLLDDISERLKQD
jgi:hypothetical protein